MAAAGVRRPWGPRLPGPGQGGREARRPARDQGPTSRPDGFSADRAAVQGRARLRPARPLAPPESLLRGAAGSARAWLEVACLGYLFSRL